MSRRTASMVIGAAALVLGSTLGVAGTADAATAHPTTAGISAAPAAARYCPYGVRRTTNVRTGPSTAYPIAVVWHVGETHLVPFPPTTQGSYTNVASARWAVSADIYRTGGACAE